MTRRADAHGIVIIEEEKGHNVKPFVAWALRDRSLPIYDQSRIWWTCHKGHECLKMPPAKTVGTRPEALNGKCSLPWR